MLDLLQFPPAPYFELSKLLYPYLTLPHITLPQLTSSYITLPFGKTRAYFSTGIRFRMVMGKKFYGRNFLIVFQAVEV